MLRVISPEYVHVEARGQNQIHLSISFPSCLKSLKVLDIPCNLYDHGVPDVHLPLLLQSCATEAAHHTHHVVTGDLDWGPHAGMQVLYPVAHEVS